MPAQLIVLMDDLVKDLSDKSATEAPEGKATEASEGKEAKSPEQAGQPTKPPPKKKLPPHFPFPIGLAVLGQEPRTLGGFDTVSDLVKSLKKLSTSGSNTVFATVHDIEDLHSSTVADGLGKLPDRLTVVVAALAKRTEGGTL
jgi:hypothetical protein